MEHFSITDTSVIEKAAVTLSHSGVIVYPTDTVYGIGCDATDSAAVQKVRAAKGREDGKPILVMVSDLPMLEEYAILSPLARTLAEQFFPGPLTLVLDVRDTRLAPVAGEGGSVGFRMPDNVFCHTLTQAFGSPITSTSVNRSGMEQPREVASMLDQLGDGVACIDLVADAGVLPTSEPSTIVDVRHGVIKILREGAIREDAIRAACKTEVG